MPATQIDIRMQYSAEQEQQLLNSVFAALQQSFKLPVYDRNIRLQVHEPHRFQVFDHLSQPERFTHITIDCFAGRSVEAKRKLYQHMVKYLVAFGIPADHILITLRESPLENWGIRGGQAACDVDLGFQVDV
jgi:5-carboxymethyl-2-hydroxymuconate isomerase